MSKRLGGIKGCKYKTSSWHSNRFPDADNIGSTVLDLIYCYYKIEAQLLLMITIVPVVTKDLPISPRFSPTTFCRAASSALLHLANHNHKG